MNEMQVRQLKTRFLADHTSVAYLMYEMNPNVYLVKTVQLLSSALGSDNLASIEFVTSFVGFFELFSWPRRFGALTPVCPSFLSATIF